VQVDLIPAAKLQGVGALHCGFVEWGYPDSVDRCQGPTSLSVRVLMNCCS
jgi:hypothetical protein